MPRKRIRNKDLPRGMSFSHGSYFLRANEKWINLGKERGKAFLQYAEMTATTSQIMMLKDLIAAYLVEITPKKAKGSQANDRASATKLVEAFREFKIKDVEPHHVYAYIDHRAKTSPHFANKDRAFLLQCYKLAIKKGLTSYNPVKDVTTLSIKPRDRLITQEEFEAVQSIASLQIRLAMDFAYLTKLRRNEILSLKMSDITEAGILARDHKNKKDYIIEWTPALREVLHKICTELKPTNREPLFSTRRGKFYTGDGFSAIWQRVMAKAVKTGAIKQRFTFHDIRAMAVTYTFNTEGLQAASEGAGHSDTKITKRVYVRGALKRKPTK